MKAAAAIHTHKHTRTTQNHISPNPRLAHHHHPHTPALPLNLGWHKTALENMCVCLKAMPLVLFHQPVTPVVALANMCIWHGNAIADAAGFWSGWARRAFPHCLLIFFAFCLRPPGNFQRLYSVKAQRISHVSVTLDFQIHDTEDHYPLNKQIKKLHILDIKEVYCLWAISKAGYSWYFSVI